MSPAGEGPARLRLLAQRLRRGCRPQDLLEGIDRRELTDDLEAAAAALAGEPAPAAPAVAGPDASAPSPLQPAASGAGVDPAATYRLHADGGSRGNPGPAGAGAALLDPSGRQVGAWSRYLGRVTNNVAEYQALLLGLGEAAKLGVRRLEVRLDSELLVRQIGGQYKVKSPALQPLFAEARRLLAGFERASVRHIPREQNHLADALANQAMDRGA
ncbi:MAG: ribonuclease HI family protein [Pseudomonadota bacterium]